MDGWAWEEAIGASEPGERRRGMSSLIQRSRQCFEKSPPGGQKRGRSPGTEGVVRPRRGAARGGGTVEQERRPAWKKPRERRALALRSAPPTATPAL